MTETFGGFDEIYGHDSCLLYTSCAGLGAVLAPIDSDAEVNQNG